MAGLPAREAAPGGDAAPVAEDHRIEVVTRYNSSAGQSHALMQSVLNVPDQAELTRRLTLGMHRLTEEEYQALLSGLSSVTEQSRQTSMLS